MKEVEPLRTVTMRELMEDARLRAGAQNFKGHDFMDLARFDEKTQHKAGRQRQREHQGSEREDSESVGEPE